jgi:hypothetical protein
MFLKIESIKMLCIQIEPKDAMLHFLNGNSFIDTVY